ncbi:CGNR zinc finger domain-containing protein [Phytoactinopolyspora halotolerans]|uniref:CGNR zinc finger domain-containing protein n=1 Tax=Phytoactinopolyspora halotolerans TaxID=1981512 RepID=A0A6L9SBG1_9ACTN|nr:CGNR zinc finger domain-containing protein [Phytoactinopolyspora halotolerans]NEE02419.1 CGNR zinc finger domain-containing protein [Phytoactinopolyspora halotolerans]
MTFSHDVQHSLGVVVDLVNTAPESGGQELLPDVDALRAFVADNTISDVGPLTRTDLSNVQALRPKFRDIFLAERTDEASPLVNDLLAKARLCPRLTDHDGYDWHIHYFAPGASLAEHLLTDGGMALAFVVVAGEQERLRVCDAPDCERVLVDLSRNRSKRYCDSRTCGNRLHVAAYRERRRAAG